VEDSAQALKEQRVDDGGQHRSDGIIVEGQGVQETPNSDRFSFNLPLRQR